MATKDMMKNQLGETEASWIENNFPASNCIVALGFWTSWEQTTRDALPLHCKIPIYFYITRP